MEMNVFTPATIKRYHKRLKEKKKKSMPEKVRGKIDLQNHKVWEGERGGTKVQCKNITWHLN